MSLISRALRRDAEKLKRFEPPTEADVAVRAGMRQRAATVSWLATGASVMSVLTSLHSGLIHIGVGLSVAATVSMSAVLLTDEASDRSPPFVVRAIPYFLLVGAVVCLIVGAVRR